MHSITTKVPRRFDDKVIGIMVDTSAAHFSKSGRTYYFAYVERLEETLKLTQIVQRPATLELVPPSRMAWRK